MWVGSGSESGLGSGSGTLKIRSWIRNKLFRIQNTDTNSNTYSGEGVWLLFETLWPEPDPLSER